jgi:hypothetical protein
MPVLKEIQFTDEQVFELVKQLEFRKKMVLIKEITADSDYRNRLYAYTESLAREYNIPEMSEEELDEFLHSHTDNE